MSKKVIFIVAFVAAALFAVAQQDAFFDSTPTASEQGPDLNVLYRNSGTFGIMIHTNGFGINYRRGKHVTGYKERIWEIEGLNMSDPKQTKTQNPTFPNSKGYYYGKMNALLILRTGLGYQNILYRKNIPNSVEIRYSYYGGFSLGMAKPVYLQILHASSYQQNQYVLSTEKYVPGQDLIDSIYGSAPYFTGFSEIQFHPGVYGKLGISMDYADRHDAVKSIEAGIIADAYPTAIPMMAYETPKHVFLTLYIDFLFGKRWF
ncbi:MAG: hypothetical protein ABI199_04675 [Bacteroidia bacterium]